YNSESSQARRGRLDAGCIGFCFCFFVKYSSTPFSYCQIIMNQKFNSNGFMPVNIAVGQF
ncbi:MAG: hypothetical protein ACREBV_03755, partial [Candidatus Zixiibacteriota bacterium]